MTRVMVLIDADNVSPDVIEQALERVVEMHGAAHVRRAYCTAEAALKQLKLFKQLSIRPVVNIASGKNCTDIALAIDAIDLVSAERPDVAVIVSSDSDFAPLVLRLREKGCRVEGFGQEGKVGDDTRPLYDLYVDLPHRRARPARAAAPGAAKGAPRTAAKRTSEAAPEAAAQAAAERPAQAPKRAAKSTRSARSAGSTKASATPAAAAAAPPAPGAGAWPVEAEAVLQALPELRRGTWVELRSAAEPLRQAGLLGKTAASTKLFRKHPTLFELEPPSQPARVRFRGA